MQHVVSSIACVWIEVDATKISIPSFREQNAREYSRDEKGLLPNSLPNLPYKKCT
jgi:hypothetical protein